MNATIATGLNGRWTAGFLRKERESGMSIRTLSAKYKKSRSDIRKILSQDDGYVFNSSSWMASCITLVAIAQSMHPQDLAPVGIVHAKRLVRQMKKHMDDMNVQKLIEKLKKTEFAEALDL